MHKTKERRGIAQGARRKNARGERPVATVQVKLKVHFFDTDAMAVAHHANYLRWFEIARVEFLREAGITLNQMMHDGFVFPITDISCKYRASAKFDDVVAVSATPAALTPVKMAFDYLVARESDGRILAKGHTQNVFTNIKTGRIARLPEEYYAKLKAMEK